MTWPGVRPDSRIGGGSLFFGVPMKNDPKPTRFALNVYISGCVLLAAAMAFLAVEDRAEGRAGLVLIALIAALLFGAAYLAYLRDRSGK